MCLKSGGPHPEAYQTFFQISVGKRISDILEAQKITDTSPQQNNNKKGGNIVSGWFWQSMCRAYLWKLEHLGVGKNHGDSIVKIEIFSEIKAKLKHVALDIQIPPEVCFRYIFGGSKNLFSRCLDV